jgi:GBP family porin
MKKHLIAVAVAATVAAPAMAQNVTVSGLIDVAGVETRKATLSAQSSTGAVQAKAKTLNTGENAGFSTGTFNLSGTEDLGGGIKASFFFNNSLNSDSGALGARDAWVQLEGGFGALKIGRFTTVGEATTASFFTGTTLQPGTIDPVFNWDVVDLGRDGGGGNIVYTTPSMGGLNLAVSYNNTSSDATGTAGKSAKRQIDLALNYSQGPLKVGIARVDVDMKAEAAVTTATVNSLVLGANTKGEINLNSVGASYNLGVAEIKAGYVEYKSTAAGVQVSKVAGSQVGLSIPMGAATIYATAYDADDKDNGTTANKIDLTGYQVGALYALSKRTGLYAVVGQDKLKTATATGKIDGTVIGVRHSF